MQKLFKTRTIIQLMKSDNLANRLAEERTFLSYERTMLAYFRTAFSALLFGFALVKLSQSPAIIYAGNLSMVFGVLFFIIGLYYSPMRKKIRTRHRIK